jgi:hypothetical protein
MINKVSNPFTHLLILISTIVEWVFHFVDKKWFYIFFFKIYNQRIVLMGFQKTNGFPERIRK